MGHFVKDEVERFTLEDGHWVDIKKRMSYGDQQRLVGHYVKLGGTPGKADVNFDMASGAIELMVINVKGWNLIDDGGKDVAVSRDAFERLDQEVAELIAEEINRRNASPKAPESTKKSTPR